MLEILVVVLDIALLVAAASGAILVATIEPKIEKGWWLMVFGLFILALGHVTETLSSEIFKMSFLVNEIQHRLWVLVGFIIIVSGISFIRRSRMAEKTSEDAKEESAK